MAAVRAGKECISKGRSRNDVVLRLEMGEETMSRYTKDGSEKKKDVRVRVRFVFHPHHVRR